MPLVVDREPIDESLLDVLVPKLADVFEAEVSTADAISLPADAYNASRDQYHSTALIDVLAAHKRPEWERLLGVTDVDLYTPHLNFVFGQADARRGVAVFSLARLHSASRQGSGRPERSRTDADRDRFVQRAATEAIHEIGHTYGLGHCNDSRCVMWFSNTLGETDRKGTRFCPAHAQALRQGIDSRGGASGSLGKRE